MNVTPNPLPSKQPGQQSTSPTLSEEEIKFLKSMTGSAREREHESKPVLTTEEQIALLRALDGPFTEAEADAVFHWAAKILCDFAFVDLALRGWIKIHVGKGGQLTFTAVSPEAILAAGRREDG